MARVPENWRFPESSVCSRPIGTNRQCDGPPSREQAGAPENPAWFHNLRANPDVTIETPDGGVVSVHATVLEGADREDAWAKFVSLSPQFAEYQTRTSRLIPVIALRRA